MDNPDHLLIHTPMGQLDRPRWPHLQTLHFLVPTTTADELELPKSSVALPRARRQLEDNHFKVVVMGEAKRGQRTLINALIGRAILPTDTGMTMCQVVSVPMRQRKRIAY